MYATTSARGSATLAVDLAVVPMTIRVGVRGRGSASAEGGEADGLWTTRLSKECRWRASVQRILAPQISEDVEGLLRHAIAG